MDASDGYKRAALSLRELPAEEQAWILEQLEEHDRARIDSALQALRNGDAGAGVNGNGVKAKTGFEPAPGTDSESHINVIETASAEMLAAVLGEQPDWATALVLGAAQKGGSVRRLVNQLPADQLEQYRALMKHAREHIKPKIREIVLRSVAEEIQRRVAAQAEASSFESVLDHVSNRA